MRLREDIRVELDMDKVKLAIVNGANSMVQICLGGDGEGGPNGPHPLGNIFVDGEQESQAIDGGYAGYVWIDNLMMISLLVGVTGSDDDYVILMMADFMKELEFVAIYELERVKDEGHFIDFDFGTKRFITPPLN